MTPKAPSFLAYKVFNTTKVDILKTFMKIINQNLFRSHVFIICASAVFLTTVLGGIIVWIQGLYFENYPYFFDPVAYSLNNISLHLRWMEEGRFALALNEWISNSRSPFRTVPIILFAPQLLGHPLGYIATALPALLSFLIVLGLTVKDRSKSTFYAVACSLLFCTIPGISNLTYGLGTYWLDLVASLFMGCAVLSLLSSSVGRSPKWLMAFSIFSALACLSRYIAIAYIIVSCGPITLLYLIKQLRHQPLELHLIIRRFGFACGPFLIIAGYFMIRHLPSNYLYYTTWGYDLKSPALVTLDAIFKFLIESFFGRQSLLILISILAISLVFNGRFQKSQYFDLLISLWLTISVPFLLMLLGSREAFHATMYAVPLIFIACVSPISFSEGVFSRKWSASGMRFLCFVLIALSFIALAQVSVRNYSYAINPTADYQELKRLDIAISDILIMQQKQSKKPIVWSPFFDEYASMPTVEGYYRSGYLVESSVVYPHRISLFTIHENYWKAGYPGLSPNELQQRIYQYTVASVDVAVVFEDPMWAEKIPWMANPYSISVAEHLARKIPDDSGWEKLQVIETIRYGNLAVYRNKTRY